MTLNSCRAGSPYYTQHPYSLQMLWYMPAVPAKQGLRQEWSAELRSWRSVWHTPLYKTLIWEGLSSQRPCPRAPTLQLWSSCSVQPSWLAPVQDRKWGRLAHVTGHEEAVAWLCVSPVRKTGGEGLALLWRGLGAAEPAQWLLVVLVILEGSGRGIAKHQTGRLCSHVTCMKPLSLLGELSLHRSRGNIEWKWGSSRGPEFRSSTHILLITAA